MQEVEIQHIRSQNLSRSPQLDKVKIPAVRFKTKFPIKEKLFL